MGNVNNLYFFLLGSKPLGRHTEQHDVFFTISSSVPASVDELIASWPEAGDSLHVDGWREINYVDGYRIDITERTAETSGKSSLNLFFINLGGYKKNELEEFHYKMIVVAKDKGEAIMQAKASAFYKHAGYKGAESHVDDKYGIDVDDIAAIEDILPENAKQKFQIVISKADKTPEDEIHLGYYKIERLRGL